MKERPDRRRDEELAVDDVLRERIGDELARQARVVVGRGKRPAYGGKDQQELAKVRKLVDLRRIGGPRQPRLGRAETGSKGRSAASSSTKVSGRKQPSRWQWR